jgi:hypothetical protein
MGSENKVIGRNAKNATGILKMPKHLLAKSFKIRFLALYAIDQVNIQCVKVWLKSSVYFCLFLGLKVEFYHSSIYIFLKIAQIGSLRTPNTI